MSAFTPREAALSAFTRFSDMGRGKVLGREWAEVRADRLKTCREIEAVIEAAIGSPAPWVPSMREPGDHVLGAMLTAVRRRIAELEATKG